MAGTNNFLVFNEANNPNFTMSDADYYADLYRLNGLIPMIADPIAHNKMYRQWSIMISAIAGLIASMNYNASDSDLTTLQANLKSAIEDVAEAKVDPRITTLENWKESITATPAELNILDGVTASTAELNTLHGITASTSELNTLHGITASTAELNILDGLTASTEELNILDGLTASTEELNILDGAIIDTTELNYLDGARSNIQQQINNITGVLVSPFPTWKDSTAYTVGDICIASNFKSYQYLECVVAGTTGATMPAYADVGQMVTDNEVKWLVCDFRDSAPVGTIKQDLVKRDGWLKLNGATVNVADYPRLVSFLTENSLIQPYATITTTKFKYGDIMNKTLILPDFEGLFIENSTSSILNKVNAGLPNITGKFSVDSQGSINLNIKDDVSGAFQRANQISMNQAANLPNTYNGYLDAIFNASNSNSIYGNSTTVQPPAVKLIPIIKY